MKWTLWMPFLSVVSALSSDTAAEESLQCRSRSRTIVQEFSEVIPSFELNWQPCIADRFECANWIVPLDHDDPNPIKGISLAIIRYLSLNASAEDLLFSPGGPGVSAVDSVLEGAYGLGSLYGGHFNIVGLDQRGTGNSGIDVGCHEDPRSSYSAFSDDDFAAPDIQSPTAMKESFRLTQEFGKRCTKQHQVNNDAGYANTVAGAHDILMYIEYNAACRGLPAEESKLYFHGNSYGSILGQTFAAMYPDRIGRMILSAAGDMKNYFEGNQTSELQDADQAVELFFTYCFEAGPDKCKFYGNATSAEDIEARFMALVHRLQANPVPGTLPFKQRAWQELFLELSQAASHPVDKFPEIAESFNQVWNHKFDSLQHYFGAANYDLREKMVVLACIDNAGRFNISTYDQYENHVQSLVNQSHYAGAVRAAYWDTKCGFLETKPPESQIFRDFDTQFNTSSPILFMSTTLDPNMPVAHAKLAASRFPNSELLVVDAAGHGASSECQLDHEKRYIQHGVLPSPGTICKPDRLPFGLSPRDRNLTQDRIRASTCPWAEADHYDTSTSATPPPDTAHEDTSTETSSTYSMESGEATINIPSPEHSEL